ncbi:response regulator [bacterium]|nr:response regulator [bacterium]
MDKLSTFIIDSDNNSREIIRNYSDSLDFVEITDCYNNIEDAYNALIKEQPNLAIVDLNTGSDKVFEVIEKVLSVQKQTKFIVTALSYDTNSVIKAMRAGAREFLAKPIIKDDFEKTMNKIKEQTYGTERATNCKVITIFSNKGGIGKTSIATNLALEIANITKEKVALVDMNFQLGDVATFMDIKPSFDISYVVKNLDGTDDSFLLSTLDRYKDTSLYILADPPYMEQAKDITPEQISKLFDALRDTFSYVIVDTSNVFYGKTITVLDNTDFIMLVTIVNLPAIRNCQRCLDIFERLGYDKEKTKIVINRYMENDEVKAEDLEDALNRKVYWKIPNNYFTIMSSINKGMPVSLINPGSNIAQSYRELATVLSDNIYKQQVAKKIVRNPLIDYRKLIE